METVYNKNGEYEIWQYMIEGRLIGSVTFNSLTGQVAMQSNVNSQLTEDSEMVKILVTKMLEKYRKLVTTGIG